MKTIRWGIIGCGNVTEVKSGPGFQKADHSALVAVMRRNGALAEDYARRHGVPKWYDDADALIHDPDVDIVYVATPPSSHREYALKAAAAGKPVYVEKPMALHYDEAEEMCATCKAAGVPLYVAYYRRRLPRLLKVKELVESGAVGRPRFVNVTLYQPVKQDELAGNPNWRVYPDIAGGGHFVDLASHTLDTLDNIFGPIEDAAGLSGNQGGLYPAEDMVTASFRFASGVYGTGTWSFAAYDRVDENVIVGDKGKLIFSTFGTEPITLVTNEGVTYFKEETPPHVQQPLIQSIVNELNGIGTCPSTGDTAKRTTWVMDRILGKR